MCHYRSNTNKKARGVYLGGTEANCGNRPSYFTYLSSSNTSLLSFLRNGSETNTATVRMNYCKPYLDNLPSPLNSDETYQVTGHIISNQQIFNGFTVRYKAGTFIELNNGFVSGTDFVAEIDPCLITRTTIAAKTDDLEYEIPQSQNSTTTGISIKIYPTVIASGSVINIEVTETLQDLQVTIYDLQGKSVLQILQNEMYAHQRYSFRLNTFPSGLYIVKAQNQSITHTQKIIIK